jgi:hypothetical protein
MADTDTTVVAPKKKSVVIGIPGSSFNNNFLISWTRALYVLWESGRYDVTIAPGTSSFVSFARMKTLGLDVLRGKDQKPFNGMAYDVFVSIDSDIVFSPDQLIELIESVDTRPVVAGMYLMADCKHLAVVKDWNTEYFAQNGTFEFLTPDAVTTLKATTDVKYLPVSYAGMGFMAIRKDVLDSLQYPYFHTDVQRLQKTDGTEIVEMCSEDVSLCKNIQAAGLTIYLHTDLRVGHVKELVI